MELVHILGADAVNPYTRENCIDQRELWEHTGGRLYFVSPDPIFLDRVIADVKTPRFADKVLPLGVMDHESGQTRDIFDIISPINYNPREGVLKIADALFQHEIQLEHLSNQMLQGAIREKNILKTAQGCRNIVPYQGHWFSMISDHNSDLLSFVLRMDYLQGRNLHQLQHYNYNFTVQSAAQIITDIATAVNDIQQKGIVHQDIKPGNIIYNPSSSELGKATLIDFGISCFYNEPSPFLPGVIAGTPSYMSPEQAMAIITPQADIFTLGILAYNLFTGQKLPLVYSGNQNNISHQQHLFALIKYGGGYGDDYRWGYNQRNVIMDNLCYFSEQRFNRRLPLSLLEAIEASFEPDYTKRGPALAYLGNEALKLATGEIHTEELPNILIEREVNALTPRQSDDIALRLLKELEEKTKSTSYFTTDFITVPGDTIPIPELVR